MESDFVRLREIKPVLSGYITEAKSLLAQTEFPDEKVVHDVRVLMKKSRAVLKLVNPQIDFDAVNRDIIALRDVGRMMQAWRESSVLRKTIKGLKKEYPEVFLHLKDNEKLAALLVKSGSDSEVSEEGKDDLDKIKELLSKTGYRIRFLSMSKLDPALLMKELESTYLKVTDAYLRCINYPKPENLHEFRKKSKDFLYQIYFFRPLNNTAVKSLGKKLEIMTQNLGRYNDLSQLIVALDYKYKENRNIPALDELIILIRSKQDEYLAEVWPVAYKIFCPGQNIVNVLGFKLLLF